MPEIVLEHVTKRWGNYYGVDDLNLVIDDNSFITLLGPSGCGKTTTLRMIAGLETPTSGRIRIGDTVVFDSDAGINVPAAKRHVGFLFQNYALWPNMTVYQNISFGLKNVNEEMPLIDDLTIVERKVIEILAKPQDLIDLVNETHDKKGKVDVERALIKIIDTFEVSMMTAKRLLGLKLHESARADEIVAKEIASAKAKIEKQAASLEAKGFKVNENGELTQNGEVVTKVRKLTPEEIDLAVRRVSRIVKIGEFMERYPAELSGGQQQRVAIARTLAPKPSVLFMDEPLSNLDAKLRLEMRSELQRLHIDTGSTFVYVTHDQLEAMTLATKICLIDNGVLQQYEPPLTVYKKPNNLFVADFVGNPGINFIEAKGKQDKDGNLKLKVFGKEEAIFAPSEKLDLAKWIKNVDEEAEREKELLLEKSKEKGYIEKSNKVKVFKYRIPKVEDNASLDEVPEITDEDLVLGVRPEFIHFEKDGNLKGEIYSAMPAGMETTVKIKVGNFLLTGVIFGGVDYQIGQKVNLAFGGSEIVVFHRRTGKLIAQGSLSVGEKPKKTVAK